VTARTILCFGDSNTHGTVALTSLEDRRRFTRDQRWPSVMAGILGAGWDVIAEGLPGRTSVFDDPIEGAHMNGLSVLPALLASHRPIDLVIVMLGTNDTKIRFSASAFDIARGIERVAREILGSDSGPGNLAPKVLIACPAAVMETGVLASMFQGAADKSNALPSELEAAAHRIGAAFLDLGPLIRVDPVDGVHLDADAQATAGRALAGAVTHLFSQADA